MKDPICTRCGEDSGGFYWRYETKLKIVCMCDNCCKYALLYFISKGKIETSEVVTYAERKINDKSTI